MIPQLGVDSLAADTQMPHFLFSWPCFHHQQPRKAFRPGPSLRLSHPVLHHCSKNGFYSKLLTVTHQQPLYTQKFCSIPEEKMIKTNNFLSCFDCKGSSNFQITTFHQVSFSCLCSALSDSQEVCCWIKHPKHSLVF